MQSEERAESASSSSRFSSVIFWILTLRAALAIALGIGLLVNPTKTEASLLNFMGVFWLISALSYAFRPTMAPNQPFSIVVALVGTMTGIVVVGRNAIDPWLTNLLLLELLGAVIVMTGIAHILAGITIRRQLARQQVSYHFMLGIFELVMGTTLLASAIEPGLLIYWLASAWALVGGSLILSQAFYTKARTADQ